jgi:hypothetical protein
MEFAKRRHDSGVDFAEERRLNFLRILVPKKSLRLAKLRIASKNNKNSKVKKKCNLNQQMRSCKTNRTAREQNSSEVKRKEETELECFWRKLKMNSWLHTRAQTNSQTRVQSKQNIHTQRKKMDPTTSGLAVKEMLKVTQGNGNAEVKRIQFIKKLRLKCLQGVMSLIDCINILSIKNFSLIIEFNCSHIFY